MDKVEHLKSLGDKETKYAYDGPDASILEAFPNLYPHRDYVAEYKFTEFTSLCPKTGQPDFATIKVTYVPDQYIVETKSLKLYFFAFRNYKGFMESITNKILEDIVSVCKPRKIRVEARFKPRGGTYINVVAEEEAQNE